MISSVSGTKPNITFHLAITHCLYGIQASLQLARLMEIRLESMSHSLNGCKEFRKTKLRDMTESLKKFGVKFQGDPRLFSSTKPYKRVLLTSLIRMKAVQPSTLILL